MVAVNDSPAIQSRKYLWTDLDTAAALGQRAFMNRLFWKCVFVLYALFTVFDLLSLPSRPFFPTGVGSLLGVLAAIPMGGYAFRIPIGSPRLWQILFLLQLLGFLVVIGLLIKEHIPMGGWTRQFSPYVLLVLPFGFLILFPWFRYAFRSPDIWEKTKR